MAEDARTEFLDGLRVTADHLQHLQDRLREAVVDLRRTVGLGKIAWGLRAELVGATIQLAPGCAFAPSGARLSIDTDLILALPDGAAGPLRLVLRGTTSD